MRKYRTSVIKTLSSRRNAEQARETRIRRKKKERAASYRSSHFRVENGQIIQVCPPGVAFGALFWRKMPALGDI